MVDFVTGESTKAGEAAAEYVKNGEKSRENAIEVKGGSFVGFIVPSKIHRDANEAEIFFRPGKIFNNSTITVKDSEDNVIAKLKRTHMAPGEMERVKLTKVLLDRIQSNEITISAEEEL